MITFSEETKSPENGERFSGPVYVWKNSVRTKAYALAKNLLDRHQGTRFIFPGFMRILSCVSKLLKPKATILVHAQDFDLYVHGADQIITPQILVDRLYEPEETSLIKKVLKPSMTFLDLGANWGYFSLLASKCVGSSGKVYAFEPDPLNYRYLVENIRLNRAANIAPIRKAVSNRNGVAEFYLDRDNAGAHTLSCRNIQTLYKGSLKVETTTLDDFVELDNIRPDFIKMDLQGAEGLVIEGGQRVLKQNPSLMIVMEFWPEGLMNCGTVPEKLLEILSRLFVIRIVGDAQRERDLGDVLEMARKRYVNLFLERRIG